MSSTPNYSCYYAVLAVGTNYCYANITPPSWFPTGGVFFRVLSTGTNAPNATMLNVYTSNATSTPRGSFSTPSSSTYSWAGGIAYTTTPTTGCVAVSNCYSHGSTIPSCCNLNWTLGSPPTVVSIECLSQCQGNQGYVTVEVYFYGSLPLTLGNAPDIAQWVTTGVTPNVASSGGGGVASINIAQVSGVAVTGNCVPVNLQEVASSNLTSVAVPITTGSNNLPINLQAWGGANLTTANPLPTTGGGSGGGAVNITEVASTAVSPTNPLFVRCV